VVNAAEGGRRRLRPLRVAYGLTSLALAGLYPVVAEPGQTFILVGVIAGAGACVAYGRRQVRCDRRSPWTLLLGALGTFLAAGFALLLPGEHASTVRWLADAVGNLLVLAAALALIIGRRSRDVGGIIDAVVIAFAAGSVLWVVLPHRLDGDGGFAAQLDLFVVVVALTGVLGALVRVATTGVQRNPALRWLLAAVGIAIIENILRALANENTVPTTVAATLSIVALTATGQFGLDPAAPDLMRRQPTVRSERGVSDHGRRAGPAGRRHRQRPARGAGNRGRRARDAAHRRAVLRLGAGRAGAGAPGQPRPAHAAAQPS
jgi:hypothetical protein